MIELVFVACMIGEPQNCREAELQLWDENSPMACMMSAQGSLARWTSDHPDWQISRWKCRIPGRDENRQRASNDPEL